jgi:hypothetical protein
MCWSNCKGLSQHARYKRFWQWCISLRITDFLEFAHRLELSIVQNIMFRKWISFRLQVGGAEISWFHYKLPVCLNYSDSARLCLRTNYGTFLYTFPWRRKHIQLQILYVSYLLRILDDGQGPHTPWFIFFTFSKSINQSSEMWSRVTLVGTERLGETYHLHRQVGKKLRVRNNVSRN